MVARVNFTKALLDSVQSPSGCSREYLYDSKVVGLCLSVTPKGTKSFQVYKKLAGKPLRVTLGRYPDLQLPQARRMATLELAKIAQGIDPVRQRKAKREREISLDACFADYLKVRDGRLSENTVTQYTSILHSHLSDWREKPLSWITRDRVAKRHHEISQRSTTAANKAMRVLRALFNFANGQYEDEQGKGLFPDNPVSRLSHTRAWHKEVRRQNKVKNSELEAWFMALDSLRMSGQVLSGVVADYLEFTLLNGLRRREAANLRIEDVDFHDRSFTVRKTKNSQPLTLPLSNRSLAILDRLSAGRKEGYVFVGRDGGAINDPRATIAAVRRQSGIAFTVHDLRRTFITIAESLDISAYAVKRLVNHSTGNDVTAGYIVMDVERLRAPMQAITDFILKTACVTKSAMVVRMA